jgi:hypothetical protein
VLNTDLNKDNDSEEFLALFGTIPLLYKFDETLYENDLSMIASSI